MDNSAQTPQDPLLQTPIPAEQQPQLQAVNQNIDPEVAALMSDATAKQNNDKQDIDALRSDALSSIDSDTYQHMKFLRDLSPEERAGFDKLPIATQQMQESITRNVEAFGPFLYKEAVAVNKAAEDVVSNTAKSIVAGTFFPQYGEVPEEEKNKLSNSKDFSDYLVNATRVASYVIAPAVKQLTQTTWAKNLDQITDTIQQVLKPIPQNQAQEPKGIEEIVNNIIGTAFLPLSIITETAGGLSLVQDFGTQIGKKLYPNDPNAQQRTGQYWHDQVQNFEMGFEIPRPDISPPALFLRRIETLDLDRAILSGSEDEVVHVPFNEPIVEQAKKSEISQNQEESPIPANQPKNIHDAARSKDPVAVDRWNDITSQQANLRSWLPELEARRDAEIHNDPEVIEAKKKVDDLTKELQSRADVILGKVNGVEDRLTKKKAAELSDIRDKLEQAPVILNDLIEDKKVDSQEMMRVKKQIQDLNDERRELADRVNAAYRDSAHGMGYPGTYKLTINEENGEIFNPEVAPKAEKVAVQEPEQPAKQPDRSEPANQPELKLEEKPSKESVAEQPTKEEPQKQEEKTPEQIHQAIVQDLIKNQVRAGSPRDVSIASANIVAQFFKTMSDLYGGERGNALDWYNREGAQVLKQGEKTKQLSQKKLNSKSGSFTAATETARAVIRLMKKADASTFIHESAHHFLDIMSRYALEEGAPEKLVSDVAAIKNWLGKESGEFGGYTRKQHEAFARGFERYLYEGIAPTEEMASVFAKFQKWFTDIYKTLKAIPDQKPEISDDIRNVFDRMLGGSGSREITITNEPKLNLEDNIKNEKLKNIFTKVPRAPETLTEWLAKKGGLKPTAELKSMDADKSHIDPLTGKAKIFTNKLIKDDGMNLEDAALAAWEAGYFPEFGDVAGGNRPKESDLLAKIKEDLDGNEQYSHKDATLVAEHNEAKQYNAEMDKVSHETGIDTQGKTHDEFWDEVARYYNEQKWVEQEHEMSQDAQKAFELQEKLEKDFIESRGDSWEPEKEPTHATLEDLENVRKQEELASRKGESTVDNQQPERSAGIGERGEENVRQVGSGAEFSGRDSAAIPEGFNPETAAEPAAAEPNPEPIGSGGSSNGSEKQSARNTESYYVDKGNRFRLDKFRTGDNAMTALEEMVARNSDFMDARYGTDSYKQAKLIQANKMLLAQTSVEIGKIIGKGRQAITLKDKLEYIRLTSILDVAGQIRAQLQSDWGHAGHALREVVSVDGIEDVDSFAKKVTGKTLDQVQDEMDAMHEIRDPEAQAQFVNEVRTGDWENIEDITLAAFRNAILSNPITHIVYLLGNTIKSVRAATLERGIAIGLGKMAENRAKARGLEFDPKDRFHGGSQSVMLGAMYNGFMNAIPVARAAFDSGVPFMRGAVQNLAKTALDNVFFATKEQSELFTDSDRGLLEKAQQEAKEKGVKREDINEALALNNADPEKAKAQAVAYPAIHEYIKSQVAAGTKEYKQSIPGQIGRALTVPERSIQAIHTLSYAMNYEMEIAGMAYEDGIQAGKSGDDLNIHVANYVQHPPVDAVDKAHQNALIAIYMNKPKYGSFQQKLSSLVQNKSRVVRLVTQTAMPFVQIGANILDEGFLERTPLGFLKQSVRDNLSGKNGGQAKYEQQAKMIAGSGVASAVFGLALNGNITGGWSSDPKVRNVQEHSGFKPYSLKIGNLYIPMKKYLGDLGPVIGATADFANMCKDGGKAILDYANGNADDASKHVENMASGLSAAFGDNVADETWMNGLSNVVNSLRDSQHAWKYFENIAAGFIPYSSALNQLRQWTDPSQRETQGHGISNLWGLGPKIANRIPGSSYMLDKKIGVLGDVLPSGTSLSPSIQKNDPITTKLDQLGVGISMPNKKILGVDLTNEEYSKLCVTTGVGLKQMLWSQDGKGLFQSNVFQKANNYEQTQMINNVVSLARSAGRSRMLHDNSDLFEKVKQLAIKTKGKSAQEE